MTNQKSKRLLNWIAAASIAVAACAAANSFVWGSRQAHPITATFTSTYRLAAGDSVKPVISLPANDTIFLNAAFNPMQGVTAQDNADGNVTDKIHVSGNVDPAAEGQYVLTYTVADAAGNTAEATRTVIVKKDTAAPTITLPGDNDVILGSEFDPLAGVSAADDADGDVTGRIFVNGGVNTTVAGQYTLTYYVTDTAGNKAQAARILTVKETAGTNESGATTEPTSNETVASTTNTAAGTETTSKGSGNTTSPLTGDVVLPGILAAVILAAVSATILIKKKRVK